MKFDDYKFKVSQSALGNGSYSGQTKTSSATDSVVIGDNAESLNMQTTVRFQSYGRTDYYWWGNQYTHQGWNQTGYTSTPVTYTVNTAQANTDDIIILKISNHRAAHFDIQPVVSVERGAPPEATEEETIPVGTFTLKAQGGDGDTGNPWKMTFNDLPVTDEYGNAYKYYFVEVGRSPTNYSIQTIEGNMGTAANPLTTSDDVVITNNTPEKEKITATKIWLDENDQALSAEQVSGVQVKFQLLKNGSPATSADTKSDIEQAISGNGTATWVLRGDKTDDYSVQETGYKLPGWSEFKQVPPSNVGGTVSGNVSDGFTITNKVETTEVGIKKTWVHGKNTNLPLSLEVELSNGEKRTLDSTNNWSATISDLPKYDLTTGAEIQYSWSEEELPAGYYLSDISEETVSGVPTTMLTNAFTDSYMPKMTIKGKKIWNDNGSADRPASITVNLYKDTETEPYRSITVNAPAAGSGNQDQWPFEFTNLPVFNEDGSVIQYHVQEVLPTGYTDEYNISTSFEQASYVPR